jgi:hypothetical protein
LGKWLGGREIDNANVVQTRDSSGWYARYKKNLSTKTFKKLLWVWSCWTAACRDLHVEAAEHCYCHLGILGLNAVSTPFKSLQETASIYKQS